MRRTKTMVLAGLLSLLWGCQFSDPHEQAKEEAKQRFNKSKADIKYLLALDQFEHGQIQRAKRSVQEAIGLVGDAPQYYVLMAKVFIEEGQLANADKALQAISEMTDGGAEHAYLSGLLAERYGRLEEARDHYQEALRLSPHDLNCLMAYAETLVNLNHLQQALDVIENRLHDFDGHGRMHALMGEILRLQERHGEAASAFRRAVTQFPQDQELLEAHAMEAYRAKRYQDAVPALRALMAELDGEAPAHIVRTLAHSYMEIEEHEAALVNWQDFTRRQPRDVQALMMQTRCQISLRDFSGALRSAQQAVRVAPEKPGTQLMLGFVYVQQENWIRARQVLEAAVRVDPRDGMALCLLGQVEEATGRPDHALVYYRQALQRDPGNQLAQHLLSELRAVGLSSRRAALNPNS